MTKNAGDTSTCLNCDAHLDGQYCAQCGQRSSTRFISLFELLRDAFGDMFELDSRLWRTLIPLLIKPGRLTRDYLVGRRARYMPPFRMYLVLSLVFFLVAFFNPRDNLAIFYEPAPDAPSEVVDEERAAEIEAARQEAQRALEELAANGVIDEVLIAPDGPLNIDQGDAVEDDASGDASEDDQSGNDEDETGFNLTFNDEGSSLECDTADLQLGDSPEWLKRRLTPERFVQVCERWMAVGASGLAAAVLDKVPAALIVLLPLIAIVLKLLYPLSRRYYVEHLLFFVHFHSFFFLILTLQVLWSRLISITPLADVFAVLPIVAASFYVPVYLFLGMRHVYSQGRLLTFVKFIALSTTYLFGFMLVMFSALLIAVFSV